jgi:hypothetical protein
MRARCERLRESERRRLGRGIERDVGALALSSAVTEANVVLTALSVSRAVGSRTSMSITSTPGSARLSASGLSSIE